MKINITAGDCLNAILETKYKTERFIPFREAMIKGGYSSKLFSKAFLEERAKTHSVSIQEYTHNLQDFLLFLKDIQTYDSIVLWFGDEPFCQENVKVILQTLVEHEYHGDIILNVVVEETGELINQQIIQSK